MSVSDYRSLELDKLLAERDTKLAEARESRKLHAAGELTNPRMLRAQRREIATINTLVAEKRRESNVVKEKDNA